MNRYLRKPRQVLLGKRCEARLDLVGLDPAALSDERRQDRRVVAGADADMDRALARLRVDGGDPGGVQRGLAVVDALGAVEHHQHVGIKL